MVSGLSLVDFVVGLDLVLNLILAVLLSFTAMHCLVAAQMSEGFPGHGC